MQFYKKKYFHDILNLAQIKLLRPNKGMYFCEHCASIYFLVSPAKREGPEDSALVMERSSSTT